MSENKDKKIEEEEEEEYNLEYCPGCDTGTDAIWSHLYIDCFGEEVYHPCCYFRENEK